MAFWNDAMQKVQHALQGRQEKQPLSNRENGGFSGYQPRVGRRSEQKENTGFQPRMGNTANMADMLPGGVDPSVLANMRTIGGQQTSQQPMMGVQGQQRYFTNAQPVQPQHQQPYFSSNQQQQRYQPPMMAQPMSQPMPQPVQPMPQMAQPMPQPQQSQSNTVYFPGDYQAEDGAYRTVMRVAQVTGVTSCFRVIEFMYNGEAVIVNAELISDLVEADRCMDLIFGAACAFRQRLIRISGKQIYLITPPQVRVESYESMLRAGLEDIDQRWPGARQNGMAGQGSQGAQGGFNRSQPFTGQMTRDDFAPNHGRRANRSSHQGDYTDYGGFGARR